jgi:hypothetical protein
MNVGNCSPEKGKRGCIERHLSRNGKDGVFCKECGRAKVVASHSSGLKGVLPCKDDRMKFQYVQAKDGLLLQKQDFFLLERWTDNS